MHVGFCRLRKALKKIFHEFHLEITDSFCGDLRLYNAVRPTAKVHGSGAKRFVHGHQKIARAQYAALGAEGLQHRLAERDADVFDGVMLVHVEVAPRVQDKIKRAVPRNQLEHVVKETNSRGDETLSTPIEIQL